MIRATIYIEPASNFRGNGKKKRGHAMLSKCANPGCSEAFRYLGEGRLFQVERMVNTDGGKSMRRVEHYWLCASCSQAMRVGVLENEALLIFSDPDGTVTNTSRIDAVHAA